MNPVETYQDTFIGNVKEEDLEVAFNKSFQYWSDKAKNLVVTAEQPGVRHLKNVWPLSSANPCDALDFHRTFVKTSKDVSEIMKWFNKNKNRIDFHRVCAEKNTRGEVVAASKNGHKLAIEFRDTFCAGTVMKGAKEVKVAAARIELVKALWSEINVKKPNNEVDYSQKGSLVQTLKEHKMLYGNFDKLPELCYQKDKTGKFYMSKFFAGDNKTDLFTTSELTEMEQTIRGHPDGQQIIDSAKTMVLLDDGKKKERFEATESIKKNSMTMDYGFMFWLIMHLGEFTVSQIIEILLNCHNINLNSTSDKKCVKYIEGKHEGFKDRVGKVPINQTFGALKNVLIEFKGPEKKLLDNPFFVTDKVILEVLKIAGSFPMIYNRAKIFGFHELFCIKNIIRLNINKKVIESFMRELDENEKAKGHIIHRGLVGSLFCNISQIDSDHVTFKIKG